MNIFLSFRFTGADMAETDKFLGQVCEQLSQAGHDPICTFWKEPFFQENKYNLKQVFNYAFKELDKADMLLALVDSPEKSTGMLLEIGYAKAKGKKIIMAVKKGVNAGTLPEFADEVFEFYKVEDIIKAIEEVLVRL